MILGVDEVGRGSWAGPVVAAAVVLPKRIPGLKDSKKLSRLERQRLAYLIRRKAAAIGIGWIAPGRVDRMGLQQSIRLAMQLALKQVPPIYEQIIIDGNYQFLTQKNCQAIIDADDLIPEVSAASIIAKVARDNYMIQMASCFPLYQFERHVGYGTKLHQELLKLHGICALHRLSYRPVKFLAGK